MAKNKVKHQIKIARQAGMSPLDIAKMRAIAKIEAEKMENEAVEKSFLLMLAIPLNVLVNDYWSKSAKKRAPRFIDDVIDLFQAWKDGIVTDEDLENLLKDYAGVTVADVVEKCK